MPKEPGDRIGRYIIDRRLGAGGMAEAYLAHQEGMAGFKKQLVIKVLHAFHASDQNIVHNFLREARVGGRLNHANIIQIFDLGEERGLHYIVMEYINGLTLLQATKRCWAMGQGIPIDVAVRIVTAAAHGLHHAHTLKNADGSEGGIIHRDLSPDNIMIAVDGTVKVLDFGVARIGGAEATKSGDIKGKIPFMPPEQLEGGIDVDARADLYALGVTLYWCLAARRPFAGGNDALTMRAIMDDIPEPVRKYNANVSPELEAVVMNLLEKDRDKRIASAEKLAKRLMKLVPATQDNPIAKFIERLRMFDDDPPEKRPEARVTGGWPAIKLPVESTDSSLVLPAASLEDVIDASAELSVDDALAVTDRSLPAPARTDSDGSSSSFPLVSDVASVSITSGGGAVKLREAPRRITGLFGDGQVPRSDSGEIAGIPDVEEHEMAGMRSTTVLAGSDAATVVGPSPLATDGDASLISVPSVTPTPPLEVGALAGAIEGIDAEATARNDVTLDENARLPSFDDVSPSTVRLPAQARREKRQRSLVYAAAAAAGVIVAAALVTALASRDPDVPVPVAVPARATAPPQRDPLDVPALPVPPADDVDDVDDVDSAHAVVETAGDTKVDSRAPVTMRDVYVIGPPTLRWLTASGKLLGEGTRTLQVADNEKVLVAHDTRREGRTSVPMAKDTKEVDYVKLPHGTLIVKITGDAKSVKLGSDKISAGAPVDVVAGTYKLIVEGKASNVVKQAKVRANAETVVNVDVPAK